LIFGSKIQDNKIFDSENTYLTAKITGSAWRHANIGRLLNNAVRRSEAVVLELMSERGHEETRIAHVSPTRNLDVEKTRLTKFARSLMVTTRVGAAILAADISCRRMP
jgi:hypothetical protein